MVAKIDLGDITAEVVKKDIKNVHLSVHPPTGKVRISAPQRMSLDTIRVFAISKLGWIKKQQARMRAQERETPREYLDRESHYVWGQRVLLEVAEHGTRRGVLLKHRRLILRVRSGTTPNERETILEEWYRNELKQAALPLIVKWESVIGLKVRKFYVQRMKTKWGSCNTIRKTIRLNTELAKKPKVLLEYIIVHELIHFIEPTHGKKFILLMDEYLPGWRDRRNALNAFDLHHERWNHP